MSKRVRHFVWTSGHYRNSTCPTRRAEILNVEITTGGETTGVRAILRVADTSDRVSGSPRNARVNKVNFNRTFL